MNQHQQLTWPLKSLLWIRHTGLNTTDYWLLHSSSGTLSSKWNELIRSISDETHLKATLDHWSCNFYFHKAFSSVSEHLMLPSHKLYGDANSIQQELAPTRTAKSTRAWFHGHGITALIWSANISDLKPGIDKREISSTRYNNAHTSWTLTEAQHAHHVEPVYSTMNSQYYTCFSFVHPIGLRIICPHQLIVE